MAHFDRLALVACVVGVSGASVDIELARSGTVSAGVFRSRDGSLVQHLFSGKSLPAGEHTIDVGSSLDSEAGAEGGLEVRAVSNPGAVYEWQGVVGNTGPLNGPGALKGLNPPFKIQVVGDRAVWGVGYNERQPAVFSFNLSSPQISSPVSLNAFDRLFTDFATDGRLVYLANVGFPTSNNYYHLNETFVVAYDLNKHSTVMPSLLCMHNFTDPGATTVICDTATSRPNPPFHCQTDGCISTSNPDTWLALDWTRRNTTSPPECNSNTSWTGNCRYTHAPTGIAVARQGQTLLVAHAAEQPPVIRAFDKTGGRLIGTLAIAATRLVMAPDDQSFWALLSGTGGGRIGRYQTPSETDSTRHKSNGASHARAESGASAAPVELAVVTGVDTACAISVHPLTSELYVTERISQSVLVFPPSGGAREHGTPWGTRLNLTFPYLPHQPGGTLRDEIVCASVAFTETGDEAWVTDPGNRRIIRVNVNTEEILDTVMFLTVQYACAVDWANPTRVFSNFLEFEVDYHKPLAEGWRFVHNWESAAGPEYHAAIGLDHWSFAGFQSVVTVGGHTVGMVTVDPGAANGTTGGSFSRVVELMPNKTLRPIRDFSFATASANSKFPPYRIPDLHPDGSLRFADSRKNSTVIWRAPFDATVVNWTTWTAIANVSNKPPNPPVHGGGQGGTHPVMDVELPTSGPFSATSSGPKALLVTLDAGNTQNYSRFHLGAAPWRPSPEPANATAQTEWSWTAMPGGLWNITDCNVSTHTPDGAIFGDVCITEPDGSLDRCGAVCDQDGHCVGHFPCTASLAMTVAGQVIVGFNGEGWHNGEANQWLHYDGVTGLFLGQFGTVNNAHDLSPKFDYAGGGYALPGAAGNAFGANLVSGPDGKVYLYHNDESAHGGVHRWSLSGLEHIERFRVPINES